MKFNLQMFAEAVQGKKIIYLYRLLEEAATADGAAIAFVTENERTTSKDADSTATKDGNIRTPGVAEIEHSVTSILATGDPLIEKLESALHKDKIIEIWEVNLAEPVQDKENKFKGTYYQGYLTEFDITSSAEDFTELSFTFGINGNGAAGEVTVSAEQQEQATYAFKDAVKTGA